MHHHRPCSTSEVADALEDRTGSLIQRGQLAELALQDERLVEHDAGPGRAAFDVCLLARLERPPPPGNSVFQVTHPEPSIGEKDARRGNLDVVLRYVLDIERLQEACGGAAQTPAAEVHRPEMAIGHGGPTSVANTLGALERALKPRNGRGDVAHAIANVGDV